MEDMNARIESYLPGLIALRHDLHQHPELGFQEERTARVVAEHLKSYGLQAQTGWAKTGVVGLLRNGTSLKTIALRADMDALAVEEKGALDYRSRHHGVMHACGHDGHIVMLLGAARCLAENPNFDGTVVFIFQPAEEGGGGGNVMVQEGLIEEFGIQAIYGLHNFSGMEAGTIATRPGPIMAATDNFEILLHGEGAHAAFPHNGIDPIVAASGIVTALQTIVSREMKALDSAVLSVTQFHAGTAYNVIPDEAVLRGCTRYQTPETGVQLKEAIERVAAGVSSSHQAHYTLNYMDGYPPTINTPEETEVALRAAAQAVGHERVDGNTAPLLASEDFSYFLQKIPGCYVLLGNGVETRSHGSLYDFNDGIIPAGIRYWCALVEQELGASQG